MNQYDYGERTLDPRVGRFFTVDPISAQYPELTPYQYASNRPIDGIDLDGLEHKSVKDVISILAAPQTALTDKDVRKGALERVNKTIIQPIKNFFKGGASNSINPFLDPPLTTIADPNQGKNRLKQAVEIGKQALPNVVEGAIETVKDYVDLAKRAFVDGDKVALGAIGVEAALFFFPFDEIRFVKGLRVFSIADDIVMGKYGKVGGHHVHAKAAFVDNLNYDPNAAFAISQEFMKRKGWDHIKMNTKQRQLFAELARSGRPNTLTEHTVIAVEVLVAGGATRQEARRLVAESLINLRNQRVSAPTNIPWHKPKNNGQ